MPVEGIGISGGGQVDEAEKRKQTDRVDQVKEDDIEQRAQVRRESSIGEVDETA